MPEVVDVDEVPRAGRRRVPDELAEVEVAVAQPVRRARRRRPAARPGTRREGRPRRASDGAARGAVRGARGRRAAGPWRGRPWRCRAWRGAARRRRSARRAARRAAGRAARRRRPRGRRSGASEATGVPSGQTVAARPPGSTAASGCTQGGSRMPCRRGCAATASRRRSASGSLPCGVGLGDEGADADDEGVVAFGEHGRLAVSRRRCGRGRRAGAHRVVRGMAAASGGMSTRRREAGPGSSPAARAVCRPPHPRPHGVVGQVSPARAALPSPGRRSAPQHPATDDACATTASTPPKTTARRTAAGSTMASGDQRVPPLAGATAGQGRHRSPDLLSRRRGPRCVRHGAAPVVCGRRWHRRPPLDHHS